MIFLRRFALIVAALLLLLVTRAKSDQVGSCVPLSSSTVSPERVLADFDALNARRDMSGSFVTSWPSCVEAYGRSPGDPANVELLPTNETLGRRGQSLTGIRDDLQHTAVEFKFLYSANSDARYEEMFMRKRQSTYLVDSEIGDNLIATVPWFGLGSGECSGNGLAWLMVVRLPDAQLCEWLSRE